MVTYSIIGLVMFLSGTALLLSGGSLSIRGSTCGTLAAAAGFGILFVGVVMYSGMRVRGIPVSNTDLAIAIGGVALTLSMRDSRGGWLIPKPVVATVGVVEALLDLLLLGLPL